ncbi:MAG: YfcE family phosphodiesterase [Candidatus Gracilibacteria bacterium]
MNILTISDTHDRISHIEKVLEETKTRDIGMIIHCGDLVEPETLSAFKNVKVPIYYVFGNNEGREEEIVKTCEKMGINYFLDMGEFVVDGRKIVITHYPKVAKSLAAFGNFDLILFGHSHNRYKEQLPNGGWYVNPGNLAGLREDAHYAIYDTTAHSVEIIKLQARITHYHFDD